MKDTCMIILSLLCWSMYVPIFVLLCLCIMWYLCNQNWFQIVY